MYSFKCVHARPTTSTTMKYYIVNYIRYNTSTVAFADLYTINSFVIKHLNNAMRNFVTNDAWFTYKNDFMARYVKVSETASLRSMWLVYTNIMELEMFYQISSCGLIRRTKSYKGVGFILGTTLYELNL